MTSLRPLLASSAVTLAACSAFYTLSLTPGCGGSGSGTTCTKGTDCGPGHVCVNFTTPCSSVPCDGNPPSVCAPDPCDGGPLDCTCAQPAVCQGYGFCDVPEPAAGAVDCFNGG